MSKHDDVSVGDPIVFLDSPPKPNKSAWQLAVERNIEKINLERAVVDTAIEYREIFKWADSVPLSEFVKRSAEASDIKRDFNRAVDALITARDTHETQ